MDFILESCHKNHRKMTLSKFCENWPCTFRFSCRSRNLRPLALLALEMSCAQCFFFFNKHHLIPSVVDQPFPIWILSGQPIEGVEGIISWTCPFIKTEKFIYFSTSCISSDCSKYLQSYDRFNFSKCYWYSLSSSAPYVNEQQINKILDFLYPIYRKLIKIWGIFPNSNQHRFMSFCAIEASCGPLESSDHELW